MAAPVFIGDEITAAGYRLAGARTLVPETGEVAAALAAAADAELVLISVDCAAELPAAELERRLSEAAPLLLVVPAAPRSVLPDAGAEVARVLGIEP